MSLHVSDLAWKIAGAISDDGGGQIKWADEPALVSRDESAAYPERDGIWRILVHGDLRDIEVVVRCEPHA